MRWTRKRVGYTFYTAIWLALCLWIWSILSPTHNIDSVVGWAAIMVMGAIPTSLVMLVTAHFFDPEGGKRFWSHLGKKLSERDERSPRYHGSGSGKNWFQKMSEDEENSRRNERLRNSIRQGIREGLQSRSDYTGPSRENPYGYSGGYGGPRKQRKSLFR